jgi:S1-C subfamily serine protease
MSSKIVRVVFFASFAGLLAMSAACGGGGGSDATATPSEPPTPTPPAEIASEDIIPLFESSAVYILADGFYGGAFSGTGIVLDDKGNILTNNHVIEGAASISVREPGSNRMVSAQIVGRSPCDDLAVIRAREPEPFTPATIGSSDDLRQGATVYAVGYPGSPDDTGGASELSITSGLISRLNASFDYYGLQNTIQIDAALNHGNSGGPLVDRFGEVIGVNTLGFSGLGLENVNYAIAIDEAVSVYERLLEGQDIDWLGVNIEPNDPSFELDYGVPYYEDSAVIWGVDTNSPLFDEDWISGDLLLAAEGKIIRTPGDLCSVIRSHRPGDSILIEGYGQFTDEAGGTYYDLYSSEVVIP